MYSENFDLLLQKVNNAKDNLEKCQSDTKNLEKLLGQYKTDIGEGDY